MTQLALDGTRTTGANGRPLTPLQQLAWNYVTAMPGGYTADEVGAWLHAHRDKRPHGVDERCDYCARDGRQVLESAALKPLLIRRRGSGKYEPRDPADRAKPETVQTDDLPGSTWEDMFTRNIPERFCPACGDKIINVGAHAEACNGIRRSAA